MDYFDYEAVAREAGMADEKLDLLRDVVREEFPDDQMMFELHMLRACRAIQDGFVTIDEALEPELQPQRLSAVHV